MRKYVETIKGKIVGYGESTKDGVYDVYESLQIKGSDGALIQVENVAINPNLSVALSSGVAFQFADAKNFNTHYKYNYLCGLQMKNGDVLKDERLLKTVYKTRYAIAYLSLIPPFTLISPWVFAKAKRLKEAYESVGVFEPVEKNFIRKTTTKKF